MQSAREFSLAVLSWVLRLHDIYGAALSPSGGEFARDKRYLVYPPPGEFAPSKVQLILGLGLPMEVDVSMIMGYVMKFNYLLPHNVSYLTEPYVRYARSINRRTEPDGSDVSAASATATLMASRWELYELLESVFESARTGKACLLRAICEAAAAPFGRRSHALTAQLAHIFLTPSSTSEPLRNAADREYGLAEIAGLRDPSSCDSLFAECAESILEYFTEVAE